MPQSDDASHASPLTRRRRFAILAAVLALCASVAMAVPQLAAAVTNHSPIGRLDGAAFTDGALQVSGWAIDPDTTAPLQVHVYVDKQGWAITANLSRPDVGRVYPKSGSAHGFRTTRSIANGTHTVCAYAINVGAGSTVQLGCRKVVAANNPTGAVTSARRVAGGFQLSGYAIDPNTPAAITTHIYVDGHPIAQVRASAPNAAAAARYPHYGPNHGFSYLAVMSAGTHKVCVYGINVGVGSNTLLYCTTTTISFDPVGHLDSIKRVNASTMSLSGWLVDPDSNASISLRVTADGVVTGTAVANAARPDLRTSGVGVYGVAHGFGQNFSADANEHTVCVVGINVLAGADRTVGCADLPSQNAKPPAAPAGLQVWPDSKAATVNWSAPATNGAAVSGYRIVVSPGGKTYTYPASVLVATVPGLTNGITYTFSVTAMNLKGYGAAAKGTAKPTPIPPQRTPAPVSTSHYVRNLTANATTNGALMRAMGASDAAHNPSGHRYLTLLQIGGQVDSSRGVYLSATSRFVSYAGVVSAMENYLVGYHSRQKTYAPLTLAIGTNNDIDVSATSGASWARNVVNPVVAYAKRYADVAVAGANDMEPGFSASASQTQAWLNGYLGATSARFVFNGSADGCSTIAAASRCNNGWTMAVLQWLSGGASSSRIQSLPQIYNSAMPLQWKFISLTGTNARKPRITFSGPLTEYTACSQVGGSCGSISNAVAWQRLWSAISSAAATRQTDMPHGTDLRIN